MSRRRFLQLPAEMSVLAAAAAVSSGCRSLVTESREKLAVIPGRTLIVDFFSGENCLPQACKLIDTVAASAGQKTQNTSLGKLVDYLKDYFAGHGEKVVGAWNYTMESNGFTAEPFTVDFVPRSNKVAVLEPDTYGNVGLEVTVSADDVATFIEPYSGEIDEVSLSFQLGTTRVWRYERDPQTGVPLSAPDVRVFGPYNASDDGKRNLEETQRLCRRFPHLDAFYSGGNGKNQNFLRHRLDMEESGEWSPNGFYLGEGYYSWEHRTFQPHYNGFGNDFYVRRFFEVGTSSDAPRIAAAFRLIRYVGVERSDVYRTAVEWSTKEKSVLDTGEEIDLNVFAPLRFKEEIASLKSQSGQTVALN